MQVCYDVRVAYEFLSPGELRDDELELVLEWMREGDPAYQTVPTYEFEIRRDGVRVGRIGFRCLATHYMTTYAGNVGYRIEEAHRGHHYAARAVEILKPFMRRHLPTVWITVDPENIASGKTAERAGAVFVEIVDLLPEDEQYKDGERRKCRYRLDLTVA